MAKRKGLLKYFVLQSGGRDTKHVFTGKQPRGAALKAATRGFTDLKLRERGTKRLHIFVGSRKKTSAPANKPSWMPSMIWESNVKKKGIEHLKKKK